MTRWGVLGAGHRGRTHIEILGDAVVAVCDPSQPDARLRCGFPEMLDQVDAVAIVTPNYQHEEQAIMALEAGKHVLCEKPLATTAAAAERILAAARRSGRAFLVGHELRFAPVYGAMKALLDEGVVGRPVQIAHMELRWDWNPRGWKVFDPERGEPVNWRHLEWATGGTLLEKSCHFTDLFSWITGEAPSSVTMAGGIGHYHDGRTNPDHLAATFTYPGGMIATHVLSMNHEPMFDEMRILGTEGEMIVAMHQTIDVRRYGQSLERLFEGTADPATRGMPVHTGDVEMHRAFARMMAGEPAPFDQQWAVEAVRTGERALLDWKARQGRSSP